MAKYGLQDLEDFKLIVVKKHRGNNFEVVTSISGKVSSMAVMWLYQNPSAYTFADLFNSKNEWLGRFVRKNKDSFVCDFNEADEELSFKDMYQPA